MNEEDFKEAKALWVYFYAWQSFKQIEETCSFLIDNHWQENHPTYYPLITAIYVLYGRPFKRANLVERLPEEIIPEDKKNLHNILLTQRDQIYAHLDGNAFNLPDFGSANQLRFVVTPKPNSHSVEIRLGATQLKTRLPALPEIKSLATELKDKSNYHVQRLHKKHLKDIPVRIGEYRLNISDKAGDFVISV